MPGGRIPCVASLILLLLAGLAAVVVHRTSGRIRELQTDSGARSLGSNIAVNGNQFPAALVEANGWASTQLASAGDMSDYAYDAVIRMIDGPGALDRPGGTAKSTMTDAWGRRYRVKAHRGPEGGIIVDEVRSAGADGRFYTDDDVVPRR